MSRARPGFSLAEMMVALLIAGIIGVALTRLIINQSRFVALQDGMMRARSGTRAALSVMSTELRAISDGGLVAATPDSVTLRVPYAFGVACQQVAGATVVSLLPNDSALYGTAVASGHAWRDTTGVFHFTEPAIVSAAACAIPAPAPGIVTLGAAGWTARAVSVFKGDPATQPGDIVYLYQTIRYAFAPSASVPGRRALWRTVLASGTRDELVVPFDTSSRFQFLVGNAYALQAAPPAVLDSVRGLRIRFVGQSETPPSGRTVPLKFDLSSDILFRNNARQ
jgi:prepilin-type N-terminal cleavage/methylation domain-containing protein